MAIEISALERARPAVLRETSLKKYLTIYEYIGVRRIENDRQNWG